MIKECFFKNGTEVKTKQKKSFPYQIKVHNMDKKNLHTLEECQQKFYTLRHYSKEEKKTITSLI